jgi:hypothetical protein
MMNFNLLDSRAGQDILEIGRNKGQLERDRKYVLSMLKKGCSIDFIAEITELSKQEIKKIQDSSKT